MKITDTIFYEKDNNRHNEFFKDNKVFPLLHKNLNKINEDLKNLKIEKIVVFDELGLKWENWKCNEQITLSILPITNCINQKGDNTKKLLKTLNIKNSKNLYAVDIQTEEIHKIDLFVYYFPTRNLVITTINPFDNEQIYKLFLDSINALNIKFNTEEDIWYIKLEEQWNINFKSKENNLEHDLNMYDNYIVDYRNRYLKKVKEKQDKIFELENMKLLKNNVKQHIKNELEIIKQLPIIKEIIIADKLYVSFGDVYCTGKVKVGTEMKDEIEVPIIKKEKVFIGNLTFVIGDSKISVTNPDSINDCQHPHATNNSICFGEEDAHVYMLLSTFKIADLIKFLYSWAFSFNENDPLAKLQLFYNRNNNIFDDDDNEDDN